MFLFFSLCLIAKKRASIRVTIYIFQNYNILPMTENPTHSTDEIKIEAPMNEMPDGVVDSETCCSSLHPVFITLSLYLLSLPLSAKRIFNFPSPYQTS